MNVGLLTQETEDSNRQLTKLPYLFLFENIRYNKINRKINDAESHRKERMKENMKGKVNSLVWGILFAGVIIFLIGCYYAVLEAGLPYQDPTLEMQIEYAINMGIGKVLVRCGGLTFLVGLLFRIILSLINKNSEQKNNGDNEMQNNGADTDGAGNN